MTAYPISTTAIVSDVPKDGRVQWRKEKVQLREPLDDEILVRIVASGICHTDVAMSMLPPEAPGFAPYPKVLGHEGAGIVERVGSAVTHVKAGDKVLLSFDYCGDNGCRGCRDETPGYCSQFAPKNLLNVPNVYQVGESKTSGGGLFFGQSSFSHLALVKGMSALNVNALVKDEKELQLFSPMGCGFQTGAGAITELADIGEHDEIAVCTRIKRSQSRLLTQRLQIFGMGGVGLSAVMVSQFRLCRMSSRSNKCQAAKIRGAKTIIAVDRIESRLNLARELGATHVIDTSNCPSLTVDLAKAIRDIVPQGTNASFDMTGVIPIIDAGVQSLHPKGQMILIGIVDGKMSVDMGSMLAVCTGNLLTASYLRCAEWNWHSWMY
jgi:Zn-dependent alcohol dehydrogenase